MTSIDPQHITGLVLAGGRGARMGGVDKGLQLFKGLPLAQQALLRLAPQVSSVLLNANRNLDTYAAFGRPVLADETGLAEGSGEGFAGPLAGVLTGLRHCHTPYLVTVPCDTPRLPLDLVQRLAIGLLRDRADIAMAASPEPGGPLPLLRPQPVFCLISTRLSDGLARFLQGGGRSVQGWTAQHHTVLVPFASPQDDKRAFFNANTLDELYQLEADSSVNTGFLPI